MDPRLCSIDTPGRFWIVLISTVIVVLLATGTIVWKLIVLLHDRTVPETALALMIILLALVLTVGIFWLEVPGCRCILALRSVLAQARIFLLPGEIRAKKAYYRCMSWVNRTMFILLKNLVFSTAIVWVFILLDLVAHDLSEDELKGPVEYLYLSFNDLFNLDLIAPILLLTIIFVILGLLNRARNTLIIEDVQSAEKKNNSNYENGEEGTLPQYHLMLIEKLNKIYQVYGDVDEQRPIKTSMAEKCDITSASLRAGSLDSLLNGAALANTTVTLGPVSIPSNFLLSLTNRVLKGPRLLLSVDREDETVRLSAVLTSPKNLSWQVTRQVPHAPPTEKQPDETTLCTDMVRELACRIFTGMTRGKTQRWEATQAFIEGLENYRKGLRSPKDQIFYLKEAEEKFVEALRYDEGYKFAWYNLGVVYAEMKRHDAAEKAFSRAAEIDHSQWEPYYAKAMNARHRFIRDTEIAFCSQEATPKCSPCCIHTIFSLNEAAAQDPAPRPTAPHQEIIAHLDQAERILKKKCRNDVSEVFMVRGETYLQIYQESQEKTDLDRAVADLREATLAGWRRYRAHLASSPTTVSELAREETACRLMQESLCSLAYAYGISGTGDAGCLISHAISIDPTCPEVYFTCGRIHLMKEQWETAVGMFRTATEIAPHRMKYRLALAIAENLRDGRTRDRGVQIVDAGKNDSEKKEESKRTLCRGVTEEEWIEIGEMLEGLKKGGASDIILADIDDLHAGCCTYHRQEIPEIAACRKAVEDGKLYPTWRGYWEKPLTFQEHYGLALLHYQNRRYHLAIQFLETALPLRPRDPRASEYIGIASVKQVLSFHPPGYDQILRDGKDKLENALEIYRHRIYRAAEADGDTGVFLEGIVRTYYWLGRLLSIRQEYVRAIEVFQLAIQLAKDSCTDDRLSTLKIEMGLTYRLAWAYLRNRNYTLAEEKFQAIIHAPPTPLNTSLAEELEDEVRSIDIRFCSHLGLAYAFLLRGIAPEEVESHLAEAGKIKGKSSSRYSGCHDACLGLSRYTRYLSDPVNRRRCLEESIALLTKGLEGTPTAGKYIALARACISLGELEEVKSGSEEKPGVLAQMPHLARAQECLACAREMDSFGRHADEIERLGKRVERYFTI